MGSESSAFICDKVPGEGFELASVFFRLPVWKVCWASALANQRWLERRIIERWETSDALRRGLWVLKARYTKKAHRSP